MSIVFGSFTFPRGFHVADMSGDSEVTSSKLPRTDGGTRPNGTLEKKQIVVRGGIIKKPSSTMRTQWDALKAGLNQGKQSLYLESDRFYREVQKVRFSSGFGPTHYSRIVDSIQITFEAGDPYQYDNTETQSLTNAISSSPTSKTLTVAGGNASAMPELRLTVGGAGAITLAATITNTTTGEAFTLTGVVAGGDLIKVNSLDETVLIGTTDKTSLFEGVFPKLAVGANTITIAYSSGTITNLAGVWRNRWY